MQSAQKTASTIWGAPVTTTDATTSGFWEWATSVVDSAESGIGKIGAGIGKTSADILGPSIAAIFQPAVVVTVFGVAVIFVLATRSK